MTKPTRMPDPMRRQATPIADCALVVVGGGGAGLMTALRSAHLGSEVVVLEKSIRRGCNTELSGGFIQAAGTRHQREAGIEDSPEQMAADITRKNESRANADVVASICRTSASVVDFLTGEVGVPLSLDTSVKQFGHSAYRMHATPSRSGAELIRELRGAVAANQLITLVDNANVRRVQPLSGGVSVTFTVRGEERVTGDSVVLACDGFGANREMLHRYCPEIADAHYIGSENNVGDGIRLGQELGAALDCMDAYQGHCHVNPRHGTRLGGFLPNLGALMVNRLGCRFAREDQGYSEFAAVVLRQPGGVAFEIFDARIRAIAMKDAAFQDADAAGAIVRADSITELAAAFGLPPDRLNAEIDEYNFAASLGRDGWGRTAFEGPLRPPYFAALVTGALAHTQGGLRIDTNGRVMTPGNTWIEHVYAAGGTAAGISGDGAKGYLSGNGLIHALALGYLAAEDAWRRRADRLLDTEGVGT